MQIQTDSTRITRIVLPLDGRPLQLLRFVRAFRAANDYAPNLRDIAKHLGTSTSVVNYHITRLERDGWLRVPRDENGAMLAHTLKLTVKANMLLNQLERETGHV